MDVYLKVRQFPDLHIKLCDRHCSMYIPRRPIFYDGSVVPLGSSHPKGLVTPCWQRGFLEEVSKFMVSEVWASKFDTHIRRA